MANKAIQEPQKKLDKIPSFERTLIIADGDKKTFYPISEETWSQLQSYRGNSKIFHTAPNAILNLFIAEDYHNCINWCLNYIINCPEANSNYTFIFYITHQESSEVSLNFWKLAYKVKKLDEVDEIVEIIKSEAESNPVAIFTPNPLDA